MSETEDGTIDVDELSTHVTLAENGQVSEHFTLVISMLTNMSQNGHFGVTPLFHQTPSESVVERLQPQVSRLYRLAITMQFGTSHSEELALRK